MNACQPLGNIFVKEQQKRILNNCKRVSKGLITKFQCGKLLQSQANRCPMSLPPGVCTTSWWGHGHGTLSDHQWRCSQHNPPFSSTWFIMVINLDSEVCSKCRKAKISILVASHQALTSWESPVVFSLAMNLDRVSKEHSVVRQPLTASCSSPAQENCAERNGNKDPHSVTACKLNIFPPKILGKPVVPPTSKAQDLKFAKKVLFRHTVTLPTALGTMSAWDGHH